MPQMKHRTRLKKEKRESEIQPSSEVVFLFCEARPNEGLRFA